MVAALAQLRTSFGGEDWRTELAALQIAPGDRIFAQTGGGDTPLHLLLSEAESVTAIDANPAQDHLLQLKRAAMAELSFDEYIGFLGVVPYQEREEILEQLLLHMDVESSLYWSQHRRTVADGVIFEGGFERWSRWMHAHLPPMHRSHVERLFGLRNLREQRDFLEREWDEEGWRALLHFPAIYDEVERGLQRFLAARNARLSLLLRGSVSSTMLPLYLCREGVRVMRSRLVRLRSLTGCPVRHLQSVEAASYDAFALDDRETELAQLLPAVVRAARPGARFCVRLTRALNIPPLLAARFERKPWLEKHLVAEDRSFPHALLIGHIL